MYDAVIQNTHPDSVMSARTCPTLHSPGDTPVFILDGFRSAFNVGSAFRTAEAVYPSAVFLCGVCAVPGNRKLAHSARGTQNCIPWMRFEQAEDAAAWASATGRRIVAVERTESSISMLDAGFLPSDAFVFGNEALGISKPVLDGADMVVHFPQTGFRDCLNVSSVIAMVASEIQRRRLRG